jgi:hypothetical protein
MRYAEDLQAELAKARADVAQGEDRVAKQEALIAELQRDGHDTAAARALLAAFRHMLNEWRNHRDQVERMVADVEKQSGSS